MPHNGPAPDPSPAELLALAVRLATSAGELIAEGLHRTRVLDTKSTPTDMVTEMDKAAEHLIVGTIHAERPGDAILGEEGTTRPGTTGVRWVIDPIDGTTNYVYRHPFFSVSVGVELHGRTVAGAVCAPLLREVYSATLGGGAFRNGEPISVSPQDNLEHALVGTGFAYSAEVRARQGARLAGLITKVRDIRRGGSAAIDLCFVADGRLDAYYEDGLNPWDWSAGQLIAQEAGGVVTLLDVDRGIWCAGNPAMHAGLSQLILASG